ncbi:hypothetical protein [Mycolicibacterium frederiksbergense]|uniref:Uncharacterized protein n=1 Tax=Mycolicibacterium frederiksbergense TaxID=117567 RepID=A0A6H0RZJ0_9MYCO|nr:hypothetical protein [Mycolicibacterium frederiksbergense]QIV79881.1 hypothetical protein EXE63_02430 [Mycolicibacterium frederiksbergense]
MGEMTVTPSSAGQLVYQGEIFINPPVTRQWVSVKVFTLGAAVDDQSALAAMIAHGQYLDSYAGPWDVVDKHGPYWLRAITPQTFTVADSAAAEALIRNWAEFYVRWHDADREAVNREVNSRLRRATAIYQLPDIRATAQHDWGEIVGSDGFHEFVIVDRAVGELALVVASDD